MLKPRNRIPEFLRLVMRSLSRDVRPKIEKNKALTVSGSLQQYHSTYSDHVHRQVPYNKLTHEAVDINSNGASGFEMLLEELHNFIVHIVGLLKHNRFY